MLPAPRRRPSGMRCLLVYRLRHCFRGRCRYDACRSRGHLQPMADQRVLHNHRRERPVGARCVQVGVRLSPRRVRPMQARPASGPLRRRCAGPGVLGTQFAWPQSAAISQPLPSSIACQSTSQPRRSCCESVRLPHHSLPHHIGPEPDIRTARIHASTSALGRLLLVASSLKAFPVGNNAALAQQHKGRISAFLRFSSFLRH
jgi:hypothetical protein